MENRNLDKALDIVSKLIQGENVSEKGANATLYQEYNTNAEVYDIVHMSLKKFNLNIYEYNNALFVGPKENNRVFGYSNEELRAKMGLKLNKELYLAYFVIYNVITLFYTDTVSSTYAEFVRLEDIIANVEKTSLSIIDKSAGLIMDEIEENSFKQIALSWDELPAATIEDQSGLRAARNSKAGFVKIVVNFLISQELLVESQDRYYPTDRFKSLIENYFDEYRGRFSEIMNGEE
ncbi:MULTISPECIES: DUF6063 family protein [Lachnospira]|jgi:hypothetical protein|uniref:Uncharacterized protein n=1 Tax=Lachnospira pectinoschiza TaxID=28052 RepID=A0A1G9YR99_9FIRM|nr:MULTISPECIES: DUF6063 family protein [Lachnospira]SDN11612.1 hypothetical protein SAMN05216544_1901 [Lachnospira pectinoschiza]